MNWQFLEKIFYLINNLQLKDILDIGLLSGLLFLINLIIIRTRSLKVILGIVILIFLYFISDKFNLILTKSLLQSILPLLSFILALVFQKEIKMFLEQIVRIIPRKKIPKTKKEKIVKDLLTAIKYLSQQKIGAIIVLERINNLDSLIEGGKLLNSEISAELLISIFYKNNPLHDGAVIIKNDKVKFASAHLPLADNYLFNIKAGTRHRAGLGISQVSDAIAIIVSEETGGISIAQNNKLHYNVHENELIKVLMNYYQLSSKTKNLLISELKSFSKYLSIFLLSFVIAFSIWAVNNFNKFKIQKTIEIPIEFRNLKQNLTLLDPSIDKVKVSISGYDLDIKALNIQQIKAVIDLNEADEGKYTLNISSNNIINIPSNIEIVQIEPKIIKFKIIKKEILNQ